MLALQFMSEERKGLPRYWAERLRALTLVLRFTGLRIGIAAIQGLAVASSKPVLAVSALDALALVASRRLGASRRGRGVRPISMLTTLVDQRSAPLEPFAPPGGRKTIRAPRGRRAR